MKTSNRDASISMLCQTLKQGVLQRRSNGNDYRLIRTIPTSSIFNKTVHCCASLPQTTQSVSGCRQFHTTVRSNADFDPEELKDPIFPEVPKHWLKYNDIVYPPQQPGEPKRPAEVCHMRNHIKYSTKNLWYFAIMIRGMTVDEAIRQLSFCQHKGAHIVKEVIEEAQEMAVKDHNVEFKSNLWVEDSYVDKGLILKGIRRHAKKRHGVIHYRYSHYFIRLREGKPPKHYYPPPQTGHEKMEEYIKQQRSRRISLAL